MNIIVISLERAAERRKKIIKQLNSLNLNAIIMDAVDGQLLKQEQLNKFKYIETERKGEKFLPTEIGCNLSHIKVIELAKRENFPHVIIFEDDVVLANDFIQRIRFLFKILPSTWEHVYLTGNPLFRYRYSPRETQFFLPNLSYMNIQLSVFTEVIAAMLIHKTAYNKIIDHLSEWESGADDNYALMVYRKQLNSYTFYPFVAYVNDEYSYIQNKKITTEHKSKQYFKNNIII